MSTFSSAIAKLEFEKVLQRISHFAVSDLAKKAALQITPGINRRDIMRELSLVSEAKQLVVQTGAVPLDGIKDIRASLKKSLVQNNHLEPGELLDVGSTLRASRLVGGYLGKQKRDAPMLAELAAGLAIDKVVEYNIEQALDEQGRVKDQASKELRSIRKTMIEISEQLRRKLQQILKRVSEQEFLQEEIITTRDGRMVIPVKSEFKKQVPGFIHSSSASGATMFIEPAETLDLNNTLRELQLQEQREIAKILRELTAQVSELSDDLTRSLEVLTLLDLLFAKGRYSIDIIGNAPFVSEERTVRLYEARHPVLLQRHERHDVVPLSLELSPNKRTLVITGPNAGGKSVALKTVGLLSLCTQAGIHIPATPESTICVFSRIFVDIGDDQSIENDLSTFSSHLQSYRHITEQADSSSLVLLDEIGAGTDPREGSALGTAILNDLTRRHCFVIATTHQGNLKILAHDADGMFNGSMEFDQKNLKPTYRFLSGVPGGSYALELADRLGLSRPIIDAARRDIGPDHERLEQLLADIQERKQYYDELVKTVSSEQARVAGLLREYEERLAGVRSEARELKQRAKKEASELLQTAKKTIEHVVKSIREEQASKDAVRLSKEAVRELLERVEAQAEPLTESEPGPFAVGHSVRLKGSTQVGEITEMRGEEALVTWDHGTIRVALGLLEPAQRVRAPERGPSIAHVPADVNNELDIRGLRSEEITGTVEQFLDAAFLQGLHRVDIIHGKGTGALRKKVSQLLQSSPHVKSFRLGEWNEGGTGVTVVELDSQAGGG